MSFESENLEFSEDLIPVVDERLEAFEFIERLFGPVLTYIKGISYGMWPADNSQVSIY